jgi:energy-coupling factor transporter ATP-binding protein EcfA2
MAKSPKFMVLDETTSSLDVGNAEAVLELLRESGTPFMLFCTDKIQTSTFPFAQSCALTAAPLELSPDVAD